MTIHSVFQYRMHMQLPRIFRQDHIIGGTVILALTQFGASLAGFVRDGVFNRALSPDITDVYFAAFRPSDFLFQTCIMAAMGTVLVPVLAGYKAHKKSGEISKVLSGSMLLAGVVFGVIALLMGIFLPILAPLLVDFEGEKLNYYVQFGRIALLSNFLFVFGNTLGQYLITSQRYWIYGITPIVYTAGTILGALLLTPYIGVYGPIVGTVCGTAVYVILRLLVALRLGLKISMSFWHPDFPSMGKLMLPRVLSLGAMQFQLLMFDKVASGLGDGSVSINAYARNFQSVLVGVTGIALAQSAYSLLGQSAAWGNAKLFRKYLLWGIGALLVITIPGSILLVLFAPIVATVLGIEAIKIFSMALFVYAFSIPFESMNHLLLRAFYATKHTLIPAIAAVLNAIAAVGVAFWFSQQFGIYAIGLGFTSGHVVQLLALGLMLPHALKRVREKSDQR